MELSEWQRRAWRIVPARLREPLHILIGGSMRWIDVSGPQLGASIAFYTMFALAPLLVITIAIAGAVFGPDAARGQVVGEIQGLVGPVAAKAIEGMIETAWREPGGLKAATIGVITLLIGATGVFAELRRTLNLITNVTPTASVISAFLRVRLTAFALVLGCGFLAIASLILSAALAGVTQFLSSRYAVLGVMATVLDLAISVGVLSVAFATLIRWLPDRPPSRRAVWISAIVSAVLFTIGKSLIGLYLGRASVASSYGAAGSFVVIMLWVYYSSQILLFGAAIGYVSEERRKRKPAVAEPAST
ncbi:MAG: YihY/virulence factor BrkB family protein [Betaproteobacteria bacterium]